MMGDGTYAMYSSRTSRCPEIARCGLGLLGLLLLLVGLAGCGGAAPDAAQTQRPVVAPPSDPRYTDQWGLELIGAPCAWQRATSSISVTVAVIDTGIDLSHPDLVGHLRMDGYDFVDDDETPADANGHGTHVSGIIASVVDNAEGIAGLAPDVQILPVRVMNEEGRGTEEAIAAGILYATERGAQIINLSVGATLWAPDPEETDEPASPVSQAITAAQAAGVLVVVAAGNDFVPLPNVIAFENPEVMLVAASSPDDTRAPFSNSGPWVDVVAPGMHILSTMPTYEVFTTDADLPDFERFLPDYDFMSGTSQAAPHVAGLAAMLFAAHPGASATDVQYAIQRAADQGIYADLAPEYRRLRELGWGRIDACATFLPRAGGG